MQRKRDTSKADALLTSADVCRRLAISRAYLSQIVIAGRIHKATRGAFRESDVAAFERIRQPRRIYVNRKTT